MTDFDHGPNQPIAPEGYALTSRRTRYGLVLFAVYLLLYGSFVLLNAFAPAVMERTPLLGINVAVLYGMALIVAAFVLALVYGWLCRAP
jgi:uncharacterized membrane protein (DUF485 family)